MHRRLGLTLTFGVACFEEPTGAEPPTGTGSADGDSTSASATMSDETSADPVGSIDGTTAQPETSGGTPVCGDGDMQGDELCDDGNEVSADGCTACRPSLTPAWVRTFGSAPGRDFASSVDVGPESTVVGGMLGSDGDDGDAWIELLDDDGTSLGLALTGGTANLDDMTNDVRVGEDGTIWASGVIDDSGVSGQVFVRRLSPTLEIDWTETYGDVAYDIGMAIDIVDDGVVVAGTMAVFVTNDAWFGRYDAGATLSDEYACDCGAYGGVLDLATTPSGVRAIVGQGTSRMLWGFDEALADGAWSESLSTKQYNFELDTTPAGETFVCGSIDGGNDVALWVARFDADGDRTWAMTHDIGDGDQTCGGIAVEAGDMIVVGEIREDDDAARGFAARLDPALGSVVLTQEIVVEDVNETSVLAVDIGDAGPVIAGAFARDAVDEDAFVARLVL